MYVNLTVKLEHIYVPHNFVHVRIHRDLQLTPGHPHVGSHLKAWMDVDNCTPHNVTCKMPRDKLHGGCQVISGLVTLLCVVV